MRIYSFISSLGMILIFLFSLHSAYAQVTDSTVGGIIVPKFTSTQNQYCSNGICGTGGTPTLPTNYIKSIDKYPIILISLSQTCEVLNKNNIKGCPSVQDIMKYDTSNQRVSGLFINENGTYHRTNPQIKNNWMTYQYSKTPVICVECYFDVTATSKSKQIIIQPNSFTYVNKTESENTNMYHDYTGRYTQGCDVATIGNIPGLLQDTITLMLHDCNIHTTSFHSQNNYTRTLHPFVMDSPYSSLILNNNLMQIFHGHYILHNEKMPTMGGLGPGNCQIGQCDLTTSTKKW